MLMNKKIILLAILILSNSGVALFAQKVLGVPYAFEYPEDNKGSEFVNKTQDQSEQSEWWVMSDRSDNPIYSKPKFDAPLENETLGFKEYFLVVKNEQDWVQIAKYQTVYNLKPKDKLVVVGWVPKTNLLLWRRALRDSKTKIERKAFLLNKKEEVLKAMTSDLKGVNYKKVYDSPGEGRNKLSDSQIYQFYFIYKKVVFSGETMLLLGSDSQFSRPTMAEKGIIGWVSERDVAGWNTNLCLEPNYSEEAYNERKTNTNLRVRTYETDEALRGVSTQKAGDMSKVYMDANDGSDVVGFSGRDVAKSNPRRHKGSVMRFPYLDEDNIGTTRYYVTGQIGSLPVGNSEKGFQETMSEMTLSDLNGALTQMQRSLESYNLFFVIDATAEMGHSKETLLAALRSLEKNPNLNEPGRTVRYGAILYRKLGLKDKEFDMIEPTPILLDFITSVEQMSFRNDFGANISVADGTLLKNAVKQGVRFANYNLNSMNSLIVIGNQGDMSHNSQFTVPDKYKFTDTDREKLVNDLASLGVSLHSIQVSNTGSEMDKAFRGFTFIDLIMETARVEHNRKQNVRATERMIDEGVLKNPNPQRISGTNANILSGFKAGYGFYKEDKGSLSSDSLTKYLNKAINDYIKERTVEIGIAEHSVRYLEAYDADVLSEQFGVSSGEINARAFQTFTEFAERSGVDVESMLQSFDQKLDLFQTVFIPVKPQGATYNSCKFVIFMTSEQLTSYQNALRIGLKKCNANESGTTEKRVAVSDMLGSMLKVFTGDSEIDSGSLTIDPEQYASKVKSIEDILAQETLLAGDINDIPDKNKVSEVQLDKIIARCQAVYDGLVDVVKARTENQDFVLETINNKYYWLTLDQIY